MFKLLDRLFTFLGRKYAIVDMYGDILGYRYYIFFKEHMSAKTWKDKWLPNLFVHTYVGKPNMEWIEGRESHRHPWSTISIILKGGYRDEIDNCGISKWHKALSFNWISRKSVHRIDRVMPNTVSLFFHGIRRSTWATIMKPCNNPCNSCIKLNEGKCMKTMDVTIPFSEDRELKNTSLDSKGWRDITWIKCDKDFDNLVATRRKLLLKTKAYIPNTLEERTDVYREIHINNMKKSINKD